MSAKIVGTQPITVGRSRSIARASGSACMKRSGITRSAPHSAAANGSPQALTWNIGTTTSTRSRRERPRLSAISEAVACRQIERCEYSTPLGLPVVPLV